MSNKPPYKQSGRSKDREVWDICRLVNKTSGEASLLKVIILISVCSEIRTHLLPPLCSLINIWNHLGSMTTNDTDVIHKMWVLNGTNDVGRLKMCGFSGIHDLFHHKHQKSSVLVLKDANDDLEDWHYVKCFFVVFFYHEGAKGRMQLSSSSPHCPLAERRMECWDPPFAPAATVISFRPRLHLAPICF